MNTSQDAQLLTQQTWSSHYVVYTQANPHLHDQVVAHDNSIQRDVQRSVALATAL